MTLRARIWLLLLVAVILVLVAAVALRSGYTTVATTTSDVTSRLQPAAGPVHVLGLAPLTAREGRCQGEGPARATEFH